MDVPLSHFDDQQLILTTQTAPRPAADHAFAALITRHASPVHAHVARSVGPDFSSVEDLLQKIRLRAWQSLRRGEPRVLTVSNATGQPSYEPYLMGIARNVVFDYFKEQKELNATEESLDTAAEPGAAWQAASVEPATDHGGMSLRNLRHALVRLALGKALGRADRKTTQAAQLALAQDYALDGRSTAYAAASLVNGACRDAYILATIVEMRHHEIATALGIPIGTVSAQVAEGRKQYGALYALLLWEEGATEDDIARRFARLHCKDDNASAAEMARHVAIEAQRVPQYLADGRDLRARFERRATRGGGQTRDQ